MALDQEQYAKVREISDGQRTRYGACCGGGHSLVECGNDIIKPTVRTEKRKEFAHEAPYNRRYVDTDHASTGSPRASLVYRYMRLMVC